MRKAYLVLSDGSVFEGVRFGASADTVGELVFTTGVCGYIETLTDPSYCGQIVLQTFPLIGNYGVNADDFEGKCRIRGYVVHEWCDAPSNFRCECDLDTFLKDNHIPGISGIDTRAVTQIIRENGVMNAMICTAIPGDLSEIKGYRLTNAVEQVTCSATAVHPAKGARQYRVALIDYGYKKNILAELQRRGCEVTVVPAGTSAEDILKLKPDGIMLSNGPGDPSDNPYCIRQIEKLLGRAPLFGICLGHQLTALATGARTEKLKYGHRGANQPVKDLKGARTYITSQNHGYTVVTDSVTRGEVRYVNANDQTCEGIDYPALNAFTVQFHPEACAGPRDTAFLFDRLIAMMGGEAVCR